MTPPPEAVPTPPEVAVGSAIRDLVAARLGRGFMPLAGVFTFGAAHAFTAGPLHPETVPLLLGPPAAAVAMLAHGLRIVQRAFGRPARPWMVAAGIGTLVPPFFGVYLIGWRGLREMAVGGAPAALLEGVLLAGLGVWAMATWMRLNELQVLSRFMLGWERGEGVA